MSHAPLSLVDLLPTFAGYAGAVAPALGEGIDQRRAWSGGGAVRDDVVIEEQPYRQPWVQRILIRDGWKLAWVAGRDPGELYDLRADPDQVRNRWSDPTQGDRRHGMIERLLAHEVTKRAPRLGPSHQAAWDEGRGVVRFAHVDQPIP